MYKGTTPTHIFKLPFDSSMVKECKITYAQDDVIVLEKFTEDCTLEGEYITTTLTQEETFLFNHKRTVQIQLRVLTTAGDALASDISSVSVRQCLDEEILA